ncbi:MAG: hypothetical protein M3P29_00060 [Acidobacteriota bacterium]|nr:hypothetical protein [Acidobacteriota bacterium]
MTRRIGSIVRRPLGLVRLFATDPGGFVVNLKANPVTVVQADDLDTRVLQILVAPPV